MATPTRSYDARRRRERAVEERAATRARVLAAATELFSEQGYAATTIGAIAKRAGVALQSIYTAVGGKPELLVAAELVARRGDAEAVPLVEQPWVRAIRDEPDPRRQIRMMARQTVVIAERTAGLWAAVREGAAVDARIAEHLRRDQAERLESTHAFVRLLRPEHLRPGLGYDEAADIAFVTGAPDTVLLLRDQRGWSLERIEDWMASTHARLLLADR